ncbi:hypothetical protein CS176_0390 [Corynebacterium glutamicum]|uniref:hypothetical protein n=1 Tax=Corynebacterium glutamicum TaxID=1718 RepID=UPI00097A931E|nr:hypothetical protein [Corynebacterium glutamicum]GAV96160.1 hypothetical protein CS176_0390 [Corynebacterium glutamicum]
MEVSQSEAPKPRDDSHSVNHQFSFSKLVHERFFWPALLAIVLVFALVISLVVVLRFSDEEDLVNGGLDASSSGDATPSESAAARVDSDGDGLFDDQESEGWRTKDGSVFKTDPFSADTDSDGLTDLEEAGSLLAESDSDEPVYQGLSNPLKTDSDDDGLGDKTETLGWADTAGKTYITNPINPDTDGDGLFDGLEAGEATNDDDGNVAYAIIADPMKVDSDDDGLSDLEELDEGTDLFAKDSDGDGLSDINEIQVIGTDPNSTDSDGDGLGDAYELENMESEELDPTTPNKRITKSEYASDFTTGFFFGEFKERDTLAWLTGTLAVVGVSLIPVIGWMVGTAADLRDIVAGTIKRDFVSVGFSAVGLVPYGGDATSMAKKITTFAAKNPDKITLVSRLVAQTGAFNEKMKIEIMRSMWGKTWEQIRASGASDKAIKELAAQGQDLKRIANAMNSKLHVKGHPVEFFPHWNGGESYLEKYYKKRSRNVTTQLKFLTTDCTAVCNAFARKFDVVADGVAHESKTGAVSMNNSIRRQIESDAFAKGKTAEAKDGSSVKIKDVHWHFFPSGASCSIGPDPGVLELLIEKDIKFTVHPPLGTCKR